MSIRVNPPHGYFRQEHLDHVTAEMRRRGAPVLRACWDAETSTWFCCEGTHRLRAAKILDLAPVIVPVRWHRSAAGRVRARYLANRHAHHFAHVEIR